MNAFLTDLDNTLIFSYRREISGDKVCVEHYHGKEMSYMPAASWELLKELVTRLLFVPVTTRTQQQYERINLGIGTPEYALVCNGGILLRNGVADDAWYLESLDLIAAAEESLALAVKLLEADEDRDFEVRDIERLFVFTKSRNPERTAELLRSRLDLQQVDVLTKRSKVYAVPKALNKGNAVLRLKDRLKLQTVISAGDSGFDIPMLLVAELGLCPEGMVGEVPGNVRALSHEEFVYRLLNHVVEYIAGPVS